MLDELIEAGFENITFDYVGVLNVSQHWFEAEVHRRHRSNDGVRIRVLDTSRANIVGKKKQHSLRDKLSSAYAEFKSRLVANQRSGQSVPG
jgi:hypothetical protein